MQFAGIENFINADSIASGLSPLKPERAARAAGRIILEEIVRLTNTKESFALESTLSCRTYIALIEHWKEQGYRIEIVFLRLDSPEISLKRIASRVAQGGHDMPRADVLRRFKRGRVNFEADYRPLADAWWVHNASGEIPLLLDRG